MRKHYSHIICLCLTLCCAFIFPTACFSQEQPPPIDLSKVDVSQLPYQFENLRGVSNGSTTPADLYGDERDELITFENPSASPYILVEELEKYSARFQKKFSGQISLSPLFYDFDNDGEKELFLSESKTDTTVFHMLNSRGETLFSIVGATKHKNSKHALDCVISAVDVMDMNDDGRRDVLLIVNTGFAYQPRGIYALDVYKKEFIWKHMTGYVPTNVRLLDIDGDGKREILVGSSAPNNGEDVYGKEWLINGTDDKHAYLTVLDSLGTCLSRKPVGGKYSRAHLFMHDIDGDGKPETIVRFSSTTDQKEDSYIGLWNPKTNSIGPRIDVPKILTSELAFIDTDRDGKDDILVGWIDGTIEIRDHRFDILRSRQFPDFEFGTMKVSDLNNDGEEEIVASGAFKGRRVTVILNRQLQLMAYDDLHWFSSIVNQGFSKEKLLLAEGDFKDWKVYLTRMKRQDRIFRVVNRHLILYGWLAGILMVGVVLSVIFRSQLHRTKSWTQRVIVEADTIPSLLLDSEGCVLGLNSEFERLVNIDQEEYVGGSYEKLLSDPRWNPVIEIIASSYETKKSSIQKELDIVQDGKQMNVLVHVHSITLPRSKKMGRIIKIQDITELVQSKRAVAWASMAQRLAHEIKTPLATVMLTAQNLEMEYEEKPKERKVEKKYTERILRQVERLQKMTDAFLKFSRLEKPHFELLNINEMISEYLQKNQFKIPTGIKVEKALAEGLPQVSADRQQLMIVLQNIIDNSLNAMESKGVLNIATRLVQSLHSDTSGKTTDAVQIEIADTGKGMTKEEVNQLFQPFFSKSPGGTGLGLVITKKIVEDHDGKIRIESEPDVGTAVTVKFPVAR